MVLLLARNSLTSLPSLAACASLAYLDVSHNKLATLTDLEKVKDSLTTLIVTDNPFGKFPENVVKCTSLDELQADNVGLVPSLEEICEKLQALKKLSLNYNKIEKWPWKFPEGLVELGLAGVPFVQLSETTSTFTLMNFNTFIASNVMLSNISQQVKYWFLVDIKLIDANQDTLSYFSFQPVHHDWCNKGCGMCHPVCGMMHIKEPLLLIDKSSLCGSSGFPFSLSEWSLTICLTPYNGT